jgi:hypothetical protein
MMRGIVLGLAIVAMVAAGASAATVKLSIVPLGYAPDAGDAAPVPVWAVGATKAEAVVNYVVYAEVIDDVADDNGGLAFFSTDILTVSGQAQPVIGPTGKGDFAQVVQDKFNMFGPNPGWDVDDDLLQASAAQNVFGDDPQNPAQGCDPATLETDVGRSGPVELFRGVAEIGASPTPGDLVQLDPTDADADGMPDNILALLWQPHADKSELCSGNPGFKGYPPIMAAGDIVLNQGIAVQGATTSFDLADGGCVGFDDFALGLFPCYDVTPFPVGQFCEIMDLEPNGVVDFDDFALGLFPLYDPACPN